MYLGMQDTCRGQAIQGISFFDTVSEPGGSVPLDIDAKPCPSTLGDVSCIGRGRDEASNALASADQIPSSTPQAVVCQQFVLPAVASSPATSTSSDHSPHTPFAGT